MEGKKMQRKKFVRVISVLIAISMLIGIAVGIFAIWPPLLPIALALCALAFVAYRLIRRKKGRT